MPSVFEAQPNNRVLEVLLLYIAHEAEHRINSPMVKKNDPEALALRADRYENIISAYREMAGRTKEEKATLHYIRHSLRKIRSMQYPSLIRQFIFWKPVNILINNLLGRQTNYAHHDKQIASYEKSAFIDANADNLMQSMKAAGFKEHLESPLKKMLAHNLPNFSLHYYDILKPEADYVLHFSRIAGTDAYHFPKFDVSIRPGIQSRRQAESLSPKLTVSLIEGLIINAEEARNLAANRAIEKQVNGKMVWIIRDITQVNGFSETRFHLENALLAWPINQLLPDPEKNALLRSLSAGRPHDITLHLPGDIEQALKVYVGPGPHGKQLQLYFTTPEGTLIDAHRLVQGVPLQQKVFERIQAMELDRKRPNVVQRLFGIR